ncbi:hypothetical protein ACWDA7_41595 [Streptomyces sp. NPDC001156]
MASASEISPRLRQATSTGVCDRVATGRHTGFDAGEKENGYG